MSWDNFLGLWKWILWARDGIFSIGDGLSIFVDLGSNTKITSKGSYGLLWQLKPSQEKYRNRLLWG